MSVEVEPNSLRPYLTGLIAGTVASQLLRFPLEWFLDWTRSVESDSALIGLSGIYVPILAFIVLAAVCFFSTVWTIRLRPVEEWDSNKQRRDYRLKLYRAGWGILAFVSFVWTLNPLTGKVFPLEYFPWVLGVSLASGLSASNCYVLISSESERLRREEVEAMRKSWSRHG